MARLPSAAPSRSRPAVKPPAENRSASAPVRAWFGRSGTIEARLLGLHAANDLPQFWTALQALLGEATPHDALVAYLNFLDFETSWQATKILATPNAQRPVSWFQDRRAVDMTPQFVLAQKRKLKVYRLSDVVPDRRELEQTAFFREFLAPGGWHHLAVALYWSGSRVRSEIAIRRTAQQGNFTDDEMALLGALYPHIDTVLTRLLALEEERARRRSLESFNHHLPFALLFLDWEMAPLHVNQAGLEQAALWNFGPAKARAYHARTVFTPPIEILQACAELKAEWLRQRGHGRHQPLGARAVNHPTIPGLSASIRLLAEEPVRAAYPGFIVYLENGAARTRPDALPGHSLLARLTTAEREIARGVCEGLGNVEIAERLRKSVKTVKGQLTSIYRKLGVAGRGQLIVRFR
jgi:DNA-binding CsgD family transcriptional regulator